MFVYRVSFWLPPERIAELDARYVDEIDPGIRGNGSLLLLPQHGRATVASVYSRLYASPFRPDSELLASARAYADSYWGGPWWLREVIPDSVRQRFGITHVSMGAYSSPLEKLSFASVDVEKPHGYWRSFSVVDGLAGTAVNAIEEDARGRLWFATSGGLSRYDGTGFCNFGVSDGLPSQLVSALLIDHSGNIWVGSGNPWDISTGFGTGRFDGQKWRYFTTEDGLPGNRVMSLFEDSRGNVWLGTLSGVSRFDGKRLHTFTPDDGLCGNRVRHMAEDRDGVMWFGTSDGGLCSYDGKDFVTHSVTGASGSVSDVVITSLGLDHQGDLLVGYPNGVSRRRQNHFRLLSPLRVDEYAAYTSILATDDGSLWLGAGIRIRNGVKDTVQVRGSPVAIWVNDTHRDREGQLWFATPAGLSRYRETSITSIRLDTTRAGAALAQGPAIALHHDADDDLWMAVKGFALVHLSGKRRQVYALPEYMADIHTMDRDGQGRLVLGGNRSVARLDGERLELFSTEDGLPHARQLRVSTDARDVPWASTLTVSTDAQGRTWLGTRAGVVVWEADDRFTVLPADQGFPDGEVWAIAHQPDGTAWIGSPSGVTRYAEGRVTQTNPHEGKPGATVAHLYPDSQGRVWAATRGAGVYCIDGDSVRVFTRRDGLAHDDVLAIAQDAAGQMWFGTDGGVISRYDGHVWQTLTSADGLSGKQVVALEPADDGGMWIGTYDCLQRYRRPVPVPPAIDVLWVTADRRHEHPSKVQFPTTAGIISVRFQGYGLKTRPEAMAYRFRLQGHDDGWQTTYDEQVEYTHLPRGTYTFEVVAVDRDLVYSSEPATVQIRIHHPYERFAWITVLLIALAAIAWQTTRVIRRDRRLHTANAELSHANQALSDANNELFRVNREAQDTNAQLASANQQISATNTQLELANQEIQQATQRKSEFLRRMSHDLRTPMNAIIGYTRLVLRKAKDVLEPRQIRNLENIQTSAHNLLNLINEILDLSRVEAGRVEIKPQDVDLRELADASADEVASLVPAGVELRRDLTDVPLVRTDPEILRKVLMNLLGNAVKFTENGAIKVAVAPVIAAPPSPAGAVDSTGSAAAGAPAKPAAALDLAAVEIRVSDTGVGIPPEDLPFVFEEFRQVERQGSTEKEGTGLGLAIARKSVELLGGTLMAESEVGRGTTFILAIGHYQEAG